MGPKIMDHFCKLVSALAVSSLQIILGKLLCGLSNHKVHLVYGRILELSVIKPIFFKNSK